MDHVVNELYKLHAKVIMQDTHVSGHACAEDLKLLYSLVKPKFAIPFHGEFHHRRAAALIAESVGVDKDKCLLLENGDVLEFNTEGGETTCSVKEKVQAGGVFVDGLGVGDVGNRCGTYSGKIFRKSHGGTRSHFKRICLCAGVGRSYGRGKTGGAERGR